MDRNKESDECPIQRRCEMKYHFLFVVDAVEPSSNIVGVLLYLPRFFYFSGSTTAGQKTPLGAGGGEAGEYCFPPLTASRQLDCFPKSQLLVLYTHRDKEAEMKM